MGAEDYSNQTIRNEILYWETKQPRLKKYFKSELIRGLLEIINAATYAIKDPKLISDFIIGLVALKFSLEEKNEKDRQYFEQQIDNLTSPLINVLKKHLESNYRDYIIDQEVTGEEIIPTDRVNVPITKKAIKRHINKTKTFPLTSEDIGKVILDFINYKEQIYSKLTISEYKDSSQIEKGKDKTKHDFPTIDKTKYDPKWIFDTYNNVVFKCSEECFNAWLVNGIQHHETIEFILEGKRIAGKPTKAIAQLRKFIEKITGDAKNTKDVYYNAVFGLKIKTAHNKTATNLNDTFKKLKNYKLAK